MRLLLDTHTLLWALADPRRLSSQAAELLRSPANIAMISAVSAWEIATKHRLGKLPHAGPILAAFSEYVRMLRAEELPVRTVHALMAGRLDVLHRDPFDRMLAAQALVEGVPLLTDDPAFALFADVQTIW